MGDDIGDMKGGSHFEVPSKHTAEMIEREVRGMLGMSRVRVCLGHVMRLALAGSPYLYGGEVTEDALYEAMDIVGVSGMDPIEFHGELIAELDAAFRPNELYFGKHDDPQGEKSDIRAFSPEWCVDVIRSACMSCPSITLHEAYWETPFVTMMHLGVSTGRYNGATTRRPLDYKAAFEAMRAESGQNEERSDE